MKKALLFTMTALLAALTSCSSHVHDEQCVIGFAPAKCPACQSKNRPKCTCIEKFNIGNRHRDNDFGGDNY